jgi:hypothetical protein
MNQIALGSSIPFLLFVLFYLARGRRAPFALLLLTPALMALGALWAVVPDIPRLLGYRDLYLRWMRDPRMDIFFFHHTIDNLESDSPWWGGVVVAMALVLLLIALRELHLAEIKRQRE